MQTQPLLKLKNKSQVPPGGFTYKDPITGVVFSFNIFAYTVDAAKKHREGNGLPPIPEAEIEDQVCRRMTGRNMMQFCDCPAPLDNTVSLGIADIVRGTATLASFKLAGSHLVSRNEAERRAATCATCYMNQKFVKPCVGLCEELRQAIEMVVGGEETSNHADLNACAVCKCHLKAKVWIPLEIIKKHESDVINERFPAHCWCKTP